MVGLGDELVTGLPCRRRESDVAMRRVAVLGIAFLLTVPLCAQVSPGPVSPQSRAGRQPQRSAPRRARALWVWGSSLLEKPEELESLLAFTARKQIRTIFLSAATKRLQQEPEVYRRALRRAHARGFQVQALNGEPEWIFPDRRSGAVAFLEALQQYNRESRPAERFDAIHLDVEPQSLPQWGTGGREELSGLYLAFVDWSRKRARSLALPLAVDVPISFKRIAVGGRPLYRAVLDRVDQMAVMAYKDTPEKVLEGSRADVEYGAATGKKVWVGLSADPAHLPSGSPGGSAESDLERIALAVEGAFRHRRSFLGVAIHDYNLYRRLPPLPQAQSSHLSRQEN